MKKSPFLFKFFNSLYNIMLNSINMLDGHLPPTTKTIQVRRTRHAGHCWRSKDELISDVLLWTPIYGRAKAGRPARTYIQQLCEDTGCSPEDQPEAMNDSEKCRERVRDIRASGTTWWWWWWWWWWLSLSGPRNLAVIVWRSEGIKKWMKNEGDKKGGGKANFYYLKKKHVYIS